MTSPFVILETVLALKKGDKEEIGAKMEELGIHNDCAAYRSRDPGSKFHAC